MLPAVQHSPGDLTGVPLKDMGLVGPAGQELVALAVSLDQGPAMARVDLVPGVDTKVDLHNGSWLVCKVSNILKSMVVS